MLVIISGFVIMIKLIYSRNRTAMKKIAQKDKASYLKKIEEEISDPSL